MQTLTPTRTTRRRILSLPLALTLAAGLLALAPLTAFAAQTIHIGTGAITGPVYGNGAAPNDTGAPDETPAALTGNTVNITQNADGTGQGNASVSGGVYGAYTLNPDDVSYNTININTSGAIIGLIYGGYSYRDASNNTITISGGKFNNNDVVGGYAQGGNATNNKVTINAFDGTFASVSGGNGTNTGDDQFTGNTMNINTTGTIDMVISFEFINFSPGVTNAGINGKLILFDKQNVKLNVDSGEGVHFGGVITEENAGVGNITKTGAGTLTLSGANTYQGTTTVEAGRLVFGPGSVPAYNSDKITALPGATVTNYSGDTITVNGISVPNGGSYTVVAVPGKPTNVTAATAGDRQATVTFIEPANNGAEITGYTVTSNPGEITATGTASPITVTGLTNGTTYTFTVTATNSKGDSEPSAASNAVTPSADATVPDAPTNVTATAGNAQATVTFTAPANDGGATIIGYTAMSNPGGFTSSVFSATATPITVIGLANNTAYTFTVTATNSVGESVASDPSNSVTPKGAKSGGGCDAGAGAGALITALAVAATRKRWGSHT